MQTALNVIWRAPAPERDTWIHLLRNKLVSVGLVLGTGLLLLASLVATAVMAAVTTWATDWCRETSNVIGLTNFGLSFGMTALVFAGDLQDAAEPPYRLAGCRGRRAGHRLPLHHRQVADRLLYRHSGIATTYGAAGALMVVLLWIYYSAQIFLLGAEFTKVWAGMLGNTEAQEALAAEPVNPCRRQRRRDRPRKSTRPRSARRR